MPEPVILVRNLAKRYGKTVAVADVSLEVREGEIFGLIGPNGAGKTTTMRAIAGIIPPTLGQIVVAGRDVRVDPVGAKRALAYVPDDPKLFEALTVWEHLRFVASAYRVEKFEAHAEWLLGQFELTEQRNKMAGELSRGMRQKVAICCAYLHRPAAILFDEPLTGLDPKGIRVMKESVRQIAAAGAAVVVSSHLLALVRAWSRRSHQEPARWRYESTMLPESAACCSHVRRPASLPCRHWRWAVRSAFAHRPAFWP